MRFFLWALAIGFLLSLLTGLTTIEPGEKAVVRRFGQVLEYQPGPGLYLGLPWGIDRVDRVPLSRVRSVKIGYVPGEELAPLAEGESPTGEFLTGDHNLVNIQAEVYYAIEPKDIVKYVVQKNQVEGLVGRTAEGILTEWVARRPMDTVLVEGKVSSQANGRQSLREYLLQQTEEQLRGYGLGVTIQDVRVTFLNPPAEVKPAFDEVTQAETQIRTREFEARQEAQRRLRESEAEKFRIQTLVNAQAGEKVLMAQTEADNYRKRLAQFRALEKENPNYLNALWWDEMSRLYTRLRANGRIDLLDHHLGPDGLDITQVPGMPRRK